MEVAMRTTLVLPDRLINEAMRLTRCKTKTDLIKNALANLITKENIKQLKRYYGQVKLDIDLDRLRKR
jgi:Arc/MetJ family transcription regulator